MHALSLLHHFISNYPLNKSSCPKEKVKLNIKHPMLKKYERRPGGYIKNMLTSVAVKCVLRCSVISDLRMKDLSHSGHTNRLDKLV